MIEQEKYNNACELCGSLIGHSPGCIFLDKGSDSKLESKEKVKINGKEIQTALWISPDSFDYYATATPNKKEAHLFGYLSEHQAIIRHAEIEEPLRGSGLGSGLLANLEDQFRRRGTDIVYAAFFKVRTVEFFLKNGYKIISFQTVPEQQKKI